MKVLLQNSDVIVNTLSFLGPSAWATFATMCRPARQCAEQARPNFAKSLRPTLYLAGGEGPQEDVTNRVECLDLLSGTWNPLPSLSTARSCCATLAVGGRLLVAGGANRDGVVLDSVEQYDFACKHWQLGPPMEEARLAPASASVGGRGFIMGGNNRDQVHDTLEIIDFEDCGPNSAVSSSSTVSQTSSSPSLSSPSTSGNNPRWAEGPMLNTSRWAASAVVCNDFLYVLGGRDGHDEVLSSVEILDTRSLNESSTWSLAVPMPSPRASFSATSAGGRIFVVGGYDGSLADLSSIECFDVRQQLWETLAPLSSPRFALGAAACGGSLYVFGGAVGDVDRVVLGNVERFDFSFECWLPIAPLRTPNRRFGSAYLCHELAGARRNG